MSRRSNASLPDVSQHSIPPTLYLRVLGFDCRHHPQDRPIFPTPPQKHGEIDFRLYRNLALAPQGFRWTTDDAVAFFFGAGAVAGDVVAEVAAEKEWLPEEGATGAGADDRGEEMGLWLQRTTFSSKFTLDVPPTFSAPTISVSVRTTLFTTGHSERLAELTWRLFFSFAWCHWCGSTTFR